MGGSAKWAVGQGGADPALAWLSSGGSPALMATQASQLLILTPASTRTESPRARGPTVPDFRELMVNQREASDRRVSQEEGPVALAGGVQVARLAAPSQQAVAGMPRQAWVGPGSSGLTEAVGDKEEL